MDIETTLTRGVAEILPSKKALAALMAKKKITLYQGFDPSMPSLHLGNLVGLMKLRQFQKLGHKVIFLVGDFTGMIGDPTNKLAARKRLTREQVLENAKSWKTQAGKILNFEEPNAAKILFNSSWLDKVGFKDLIEIASNVTHQQMIERDMYQERIKKGTVIHFHELLYPLAQGYDSVAMDVDLEIGGNDQLFNMMMGRTLMRAMKNKEKFVLTTKLLVDKEGNKVGKTTDNALFLDSPPQNFYAGIMSFPDEALPLAFELLTDVDLTGIEESCEKEPMGQKKRLAFEVVSLFWGKDKAGYAQKEFERTFQKRGAPSEIPTITINDSSLPLLDLVFATKAVASRSQAKRLILQGGIDVEESTIDDPTREIEIPKNGIVIKIGKIKFVRIKRK